MALSGVLVLVGVALVIVGVFRGAPVKVVLGVVVVSGAIARLSIERRRQSPSDETSAGPPESD